MDNLATILTEVRRRNRENLNSLLAIQETARRGQVLTRPDAEAVLDAYETANASFALGEYEDFSIALARRIINLCDSVKMTDLMNNQRAESARCCVHSQSTQPTDQRQEVAP